MGKKQIQDGKEMNTDVGKETHTGWEGNTCRWEGNAYTHRFLIIIYIIHI